MGKLDPYAEKLSKQLDEWSSTNIKAVEQSSLSIADVMESVKDYALLRTDQNGWIEISTNGEQMWVNVERQSIGVTPEE